MRNNKKFFRSLAHYNRVKELIPNQSQTLNKAPAMFAIGRMPLFSRRAKGCYIWDVDGNKFIDYIGALGPIVLGYADPVTDNAIKKQLKDGINFSQPHPLELEVAELLCEVIPSAEMVRFAKNGSDATAGAVRIARAYTGREVILYCGYHGAQDWYVVTTERNAGVPKILKTLIFNFKYNDLNSLAGLFEEHQDRVAAVIMEPTYYYKPENDFLQKVKELTHTNGALLIFDEVITGFRWSLGGAQEYFGVTPDLSCFGKSLSNGMPLSCVVGKKEIMRACENVFFSMTAGGECLSLAAAKATILALKNYPNILAHIWRMGERLQSGMKEVVGKYGLEKYVVCSGYPPRSLLDFYHDGGDSWPELKTLFQQYMVDDGVLSAVAYWNITYAHKMRHIKSTLGAFDRALKRCREDIRMGRVNAKVPSVVKPVFSRKL